MIRRSTRWTLRAAGFLLAGLIILTGLLAWRLASGPIALDFLTPFLEQALSRGPYRATIGATVLRWHGFHHPLGLDASDVVIRDADGTTLASIPALTMGLSAPALLRGEIAPTRFELAGPTVRIIRNADGAFRLALDLPAAVQPPDEPPSGPPAPDPSPPNGAAPDDAAPPDEPSPEPGARDPLEWLVAALDAPRGSGHPLAALNRISVVDGRIVLVDHATRRRWIAPNAEFELWRTEDGTRATLHAVVAAGQRLARLDVAAAYRRDRGDTELDLRLADLLPAALAGIDPVMAPLRVLPGPVSGTASVHLGPGFAPDLASFALRGSAGRIGLDRAFPRPATVAGWELSGSVDVTAHRMRIDRAVIDLGGPRLTATATMTAAPAGFTLEAEAALRTLPVDLLDLYWPVGASPGGRHWVTRNIAQGMVRQVSLRLSATAPPEDPFDIALRSFDGSMAFDGLRVSYLDGMPPVVEVGGTAQFSAEGMVLDLGTGRVLDLAMPSARVAITGFDRPGPETIAIDLVLTGPLRTALEILDAPRLRYAAALGLSPAAVTGVQASRLRFTFPLARELPLDQVAIAVAANLRNAGLGTVAEGIAVSGIDGALSLDGRGMTIEGTATAAGVPISFSWAERFGRDRDLLTRLSASATIDPAGGAALGLPALPWLRGPIGVSAVYADPDRVHRSAAIDLDLTQTAMMIDSLGWAKAAGAPGHAHIDLALTRGVSNRVAAFRLAAPDLAVRGEARLASGGDALAEVTVHELTQGRTRVAVHAVPRPGGGYAASVRGERFDATPLFDSGTPTGPPGTGSAAGAAAAEPPPPLALTVALGEVLLGSGRSLRNVSGSLERSAEGWTAIDLAATAGASDRLRLVMEPVGPGVAQYLLTSTDAGAALSGLRVGNAVRGGTLSLSGVRQGPPGAYRYGGRVRIDRFRLVDPPVLAQLLSATSPAGLDNLLSGDGLGFNRLTAEYRLAGDVLTLAEGRTAGGALGLTFAGRFDRAADRLDLEGTIVPVYELNRAVGSIPLLGEVLTGGEGQGLFAFTYAVRGPLTGPEVTVNPLAVLAPGFLRNLFFLEGDGAGGTGALSSERPAGGGAN